jgi:glyoxylase-like metal-dependent hydrolase (beta-lactamase superfamily II)
MYRIGDLLVDSGAARGGDDVAALLAADPPRRIVLTHHHEDHAGGAAALRRRWGAVPVHAPAALITSVRAPEPMSPYRVEAWGAPEPIPGAVALHAGEVLEAGGVALEAVATPGHTPGHLAFVAEVDGERHALTGDLFIGRWPLAAWYESSAEDLIRSWRALAARPFRMLPTHGEVRDDGQRVLTEVADLVERTAEEVLATAVRLGTRDPSLVAQEVLGPEKSHAVVSRGEHSFAAFARSVLDPVRSLPASPIRLDAPAQTSGAAERRRPP